jgi:hypothetical protein
LQQPEKYEAQHKYQQSHKEYYNQKGKEYYANHREEIRERQKEKWIKHREEYRKKKREYYEKHKEEISKKNNEWAKSHKEQRKITCQRNRQKIRLEVLSHYSNGAMKCVCCGEAEIKFLSIDHINGGGNQHRKQTVRGTDFYLWLRRNNFPDGYQVLCHNCNLAKGFYGSCPHKEIK